MGIKRCPSFSKRPGFPCGLRVLLIDSNAAQVAESKALLQECSYEVTACGSLGEGLSKLGGACSYDVLLADAPTLGSDSSEREQLLAAAKGLPCIFMAAQPTPQDVMAGVELGVVDFLSKPLAPQKLRNIWQHTVRKMMCNMNINCASEGGAAGAAADEVPLPGVALGRERVSMEVIMEETDEELAAAARRSMGSLDASPATARAAAQQRSASPATAGGAASVINYSNAPNMALAINSSFYGPSRSNSAAATTLEGAALGLGGGGGGGSGSSACNSPGSPDSRPAKQQHCNHGPVRSCASTRSLNSAASSGGAWGLPSSPSSPSLAHTVSDAANVLRLSTDGDSGEDGKQRCLRKAVRHGVPAVGVAAIAAVGCPAGSANKPPLCGKPAVGVPAAPRPQPAAAAPCSGAAAAAPAAPALGVAAVGASVPLPTGLGPLPTGMVWGMPMLPLVRAPGIVPPAPGGAAAGGLPAALPWGMTPFGAMPPPPALLAMPGMAPYGSMGFASAPQGYCGAPWPGMDVTQAACYAGQAAYGAPAFMQHQQEGVRVRAMSATPSTGAAAAAALDGINLLGDSGAARAGSAAALDAAAAAAAAVAVDVDDDEQQALDFVLGDMDAEDDIVGVCGSLLDADVSSLGEHGGLHLPAQVPAELRALEAELQHQAAAAAAAGSARASFECSSGAPHRARASLDCSSMASVCTAARPSFDTMRSSSSYEVSALSRCNNSRVSFEASYPSSSMAAAAPGAPAGCGGVAPAAPALAHALSRAMGSLFAAACSEDDSSQGSGLQRMDACGGAGALPDLHSLLAASEDSGCRATTADCADSAMADDSDELFVDALDSCCLDRSQLGLALCKGGSLAELMNAGLPAAAH